MQPFDALTIRAVLDEAKPLLLNRRVDRVFQLARDELLISLRSKSGMVHLFLSAHANYGRICLVKQAPQGAKNDRAPQNNSNFALLLRKTLASATLVHIEQLPGERIVDFVFSSTDEVGTASHKVLTAEIMGRHSNLIFWDKAKEKILTASHIVTKEMSRHREVAPGLTYKRPPGQERPNIFKVTREDFSEQWKLLKENFEKSQKADATESPVSSFATLEQWLIHTFTGLGRNLSEEVILASGSKSPVSEALKESDSEEKVWSVIRLLGEDRINFKPAMKKDLSRFTVLSLIPELKEASSIASGADSAATLIGAKSEATDSGANSEATDSGANSEATEIGAKIQTAWKHFPAVNDLIDDYYGAVEAREQFQQLRERLRNELKSEDEKLASRISVASQHIRNEQSLDEMKRSGDLVLANLGTIEPGQTDLEVEDLYTGGSEKIKIKLNPNLTASQNAQWFYRQFSKLRSRQKAAKLSFDEASKKQTLVETQLKQLETAQTNDELRALRELIIGRKPASAMQQPQQNKGQAADKKKAGKPRMLSVTSSDGWTIYVGRNRHENDQLLSKLAQPNDIWLHILGSGGAHVLIRVPASKQEPPLTTLKEAAQIAARLSKGGTSGTKVRVVYTQVKHVKKLGKDKPGQVRYENEKTLEVDTAAPMPKCMKQLFSH
jgi:predicted ribosome quality control (RQC) complex YloA/Tae2 family protein